MEKETRVYIIDLNNDTTEVGIGEWDNLTNEQWIDLAERQGYVFSLEGYQRAYNNEEIHMDTYIRFIQVPLN